jgi:hypothetical protein
VLVFTITIKICSVDGWAGKSTVDFLSFLVAGSRKVNMSPSSSWRCELSTVSVKEVVAFFTWDFMAPKEKAPVDRKWRQSVFKN